MRKRIRFLRKKKKCRGLRKKKKEKGDEVPVHSFREKGKKGRRGNRPHQFPPVRREK